MQAWPEPSGPRVVARLASEEPTFTRTTDVLIIGSGVAGLSLAQALSHHGLRVEVVTKALLRQRQHPLGAGWCRHGRRPR